MASMSTLAAMRLTAVVPHRASPLATPDPPLNCSLQCPHFQSNPFNLLANLETSVRDFTEALSSAMASFQGPPVSPTYKQALLKPAIPSENRSEDEIPVRKFWKRIDTPDVPNRPARSELVQSKIRELKWLSSPTSPVCFRCGDRGHVASQCRNTVLCFACNRLGHRSVQCKAITETAILTPAPSAASISNSKSIPVYYEASVMDSIKRLETELAEIKQELALMKKITMVGINAESGISSQHDSSSTDRGKGSPQHCHDASHSPSPITQVSAIPMSKCQTAGSITDNKIGETEKGKAPMKVIVAALVSDPSCSKMRDNNDSDDETIEAVLKEIEPERLNIIDSEQNTLQFPPKANIWSESQEVIVEGFTEEITNGLLRGVVENARKKALQGGSIGGSLRPRKSSRLRVQGLSA